MNHSYGFIFFFKLLNQNQEALVANAAALLFRVEPSHVLCQNAQQQISSLWLPVDDVILISSKSSTPAHKTQYFILQIWLSNKELLSEVLYRFRTCALCIIFELLTFNFRLVDRRTPPSKIWFRTSWFLNWRLGKHKQEAICIHFSKLKLGPASSAEATTSSLCHITLTPTARLGKKKELN